MRKLKPFFDNPLIRIYIWATELLYHQFAWAYDLVAWFVSFGYWSRWRKDALEYLKPGSVLETGFGTGSLLIALIERGWDVTGLELSREMQRVTRRKLKRRGLDAGRVLAKTEAIPFHTCAFMNVLSTFPSKYIADEETFHEVKRVLDKGGCWVILGLSVEFKAGLRRWLTRWFLHGPIDDWVRQFIRKAESLGFNARIVQHQSPDYSLPVFILEKIHD
jgi:ubiquinone/menaquinone biosynthesis C-methylase UbiE